MNRSPLFLIAINKLIGKTMRHLQLSTGYRREMLRYAVKNLNAARTDYRMGFIKAAEWCIECAIDWTRKARNAELCAFMDAEA